MWNPRLTFQTNVKFNLFDWGIPRVFAPRVPAQPLPHLAGEEMFVWWPEIPTRLLVNILILIRSIGGRQRDLIILGNTLTKRHAAARLPLLDEGTTGINKGRAAFTITLTDVTASIWHCLKKCKDTLTPRSRQEDWHLDGDRWLTLLKTWWLLL